MSSRERLNICGPTADRVVDCLGSDRLLTRRGQFAGSDPADGVGVFSVIDGAVGMDVAPLPGS